MKFPFLRKKNTTDNDVAKVYRELREGVLALDPKDIGLESDDKLRVWGVLMDIAHPNIVLTVLAAADGTVSLYLSKGGGFFGAQADESVAKAANTLLAEAQQYVAHCQKVSDFSLPKLGEARMNLMTFDGVYSVVASSRQIENYGHPLSPLFYASQTLIGEIHKFQDKIEKDEKLK